MPGSCKSGYVYLGQFINHDLSRDKTLPNEIGKLEPEETSNERTARLDLEPLYRENPPLGGSKLALGRTEADETGASSDNDLPRTKSGLTTIFEKRNDSTLLIAQLHVLLVKFHNRIVDDLKAGNIGGGGGEEGTLFERAKRLVTWHYQWIVRHDFLPTIVAPDVLQDITMHWPRLYRPAPGEARLPVEFAWAVFQYGHSAVQNEYNINRKCPRLTLSQTVSLTGLSHLTDPFGKQHRRLPQKYVVDHGRMFGWAPPGVTNVAEELDTLIPRDFYEDSKGFFCFLAGAPSEGVFKNRTLGSLTAVTLNRGALIGLPSGQKACRLAGIPRLGPDQLAPTQKIRDFLRQHGLMEATPLFYYVLREAELAGRAAPGARPGKRLGPLGSRIAAEVLLGILTADAESFLHFDWSPPLIRFPKSNRTIRIDSLKKLALYASGGAK